MLNKTHKEFLEAFKEGCLAFLEGYTSSDDPEDPTKIIWTHYFLNCVPEQFRSIAHDLSFYPTPPSLGDLYEEVRVLIKVSEDYMQAWFAINGYDFDNIPKPLHAYSDDIHTTPRSIAGGFTTGGKIYYKTAKRIGQVVWVGSSSHTKGWAELHYGNWRIWSIHPRTNGVGVWSKAATEEVWRLAGELSKLTDWAAYDHQSNKVKRAIASKIRDLRESSFLKDLIQWK